MTPMMAFTVASVASTGVQALGAMSQANQSAANMEAQAKLEETKALQRDTANRQELTRFLSGMRAGRSANGLSASSPNAGVLRKDSVDQADSDRLTVRADYSQKASNLRTAASAERRRGRFSLATGFLGGAGRVANFMAYGAS